MHVWFYPNDPLFVDRLVNHSGDIEFRGEGHRMGITEKEMGKLNKERGDWEQGLIISANYDT